MDPKNPREEGESPQIVDVLRFMRNTTMVKDEIGVRLVVQDDTIRVRWNAKLTMRDPFSALPGARCTT